MTATARNPRSREVSDVADDRRHVWLASQIDEVESALAEAVAELTSQLRASADEVKALKRVLQGILVAIIVSLVAIPVGIIWTAATVRP